MVSGILTRPPDSKIACSRSIPSRGEPRAWRSSALVPGPACHRGQKAPHHAITHIDVVHSKANRTNHSRTVGAGDQRQRLSRIVLPANHHEIAIVQGDRFDVDKDLAGTWRGRRIAGGEFEFVESKSTIDHIRAHYISLSLKQITSRQRGRGVLAPSVRARVVAIAPPRSTGSSPRVRGRANVRGHCA